LAACCLVSPCFSITSSCRCPPLLYHFIQFICHASRRPKYTKIFVPVTGHRGHLRICETSHEINEKSSLSCAQRVLFQKAPQKMSLNQFRSKSAETTLDSSVSTRFLTVWKGFRPNEPCRIYELF
jgi:hypothetical protein